MKENNQHIDKLIQNKFEDFEATPPSHGWEELSSVLDDRAIDAYKAVQNGDYYGQETKSIIQAKFRDFQQAAPKNGWKRLSKYLDAQQPHLVPSVLWRYAAAAAVLLCACFMPWQLCDLTQPQPIAYDWTAIQQSSKVDATNTSSLLKTDSEHLADEKSLTINSSKESSLILAEKNAQTATTRTAKGSKSSSVRYNNALSQGMKSEHLAHLGSKKSDTPNTVFLNEPKGSELTNFGTRINATTSDASLAYTKAETAAVEFLDPFGAGKLEVGDWTLVASLNTIPHLAFNTVEKVRKRRHNSYYLGVNATAININNIFRGHETEGWKSKNMHTRSNLDVGLGLTLETPISQRVMLSAQLDYAAVDYRVEGQTASVKPINYNVNQLDRNAFEIIPEYGQYEFSTQYKYRLINTAMMLKYVVADNAYTTHFVSAGAGASFMLANIRSTQEVAAGNFKLALDAMQPTARYKVRPTASIGYQFSYKVNNRLRANIEAQSCLTMGFLENAYLTYRSYSVFNTARIGLSYQF
ncbi:MAG: hypothetical protein EAZ57_11185 [Cytophagales bacterium]|nr:MAG: hypothetical protein EAZ67_11845 [Cytophagales bacterium]TAF59439.1 MAG: hypothetical protein EAZ57_11185 [Cytophagales bacterium]